MNDNTNICYLISETVIVAPLQILFNTLYGTHLDPLMSSGVKIINGAIFVMLECVFVNAPLGSINVIKEELKEMVRMLCAEEQQADPEDLGTVV